MTTNKFRIITATLLALTVAVNAAVAQKEVSVFKPLPENFHPGSITFASNGDLFVASMANGQVLKFSNSARPSQVFISGDAKLGTAMGIKVDESRGILWVCSADLGLNADATNVGTSLNAFDLGTGALIAKYPLPDGGLANDLAIASNGTIYVTDSKNPRILVLRNNSSRLVPFLEDPAFDPGEGFGLDGIVVTNDNSLLVSKFSEGKVLKISQINSLRPTVQPLSFDRKLLNTDAIYYTGGNTFLLAEPDLMGHNGKVLSVTFDNSLTATATEIKGDLTMPVNAVQKGGKVYFVEAQLAPLLIPDRKNEAYEPFAVKTISSN